MAAISPAVASAIKGSAFALSSKSDARSTVSQRLAIRQTRYDGLRNKASGIPGRGVGSGRLIERNAQAKVHVSVAASLEIDMDFAPPPIDGDLTETMEDYGAEFDTEGVAVTFNNNDDDAINAALNSVAVFDMSHFGRIKVSGEDRIRFLHNQTTADFNSLSPGQGCMTVFVSPTARTIDLATAWVMSTSVILTVSPGKAQKLVTTMDRYIFPADKVSVADISEQTRLLALIGPQAPTVVEKLGLTQLLGQPEGTHAHFAVEGAPATVGVGSGLGASVPGFLLMLSADVAGRVWSHLTDGFGITPIGAAAWERLRVQQGRPMPGSELTDEFNPLEAALLQCISTTKGCYMGQETIARLITYDGVKQQLWGLRLANPVSVGAIITNKEGAKIGKVTSCVHGPHVHDGKSSCEYLALGYLKRQEGGDGAVVLVEGQEAAVTDLPFAQRNLI
ncbi:unnamed protein product [Closterium sp. NIES-64]|nr:unnamed protein product [Closterium sp. NIES-64]